MKFNEKYLSIPPYISTGWANVKALQMSGNRLIIMLNDGSIVHVPDLDLEEIDNIFEAHALYLDKPVQFKGGGSSSPNGFWELCPLTTTTTRVSL